MDATLHEGRRKGFIRIPRKVERLFFFYATIGMFLVWGYSKLFGD
jgi:hypothetical protein